MGSTEAEEVPWRSGLVTQVGQDPARQSGNEMEELGRCGCQGDC